MVTISLMLQVRNTRIGNRTGQLTGYKLVPGSNCLPLAGSEAKFLRRAAFLRHNLWVTPYSHDQMFPGGDLAGDEVPHIHVHVHDDAINEFGSVKSDIKSVGSGNKVWKGKNTPSLSKSGHVLPQNLQRITISIKLESPPWDTELSS